MQSHDEQRNGRPPPRGTERAKDLPGWYLSVYPDAREASGVFRASIDRRVGRSGPPGAPLHEGRSQRIAASRARGVLRRYCVANRLNRFVTLTYAGDGCHDPDLLREHMAAFFVRLRRLRASGSFPYVWVPEWHPGGHGLHAHGALGEFVHRRVIEQAWGHGFIQIKLIGDLPVGSSSVDEARIAALYLAKYVGKTFEDPGLFGRHRYEVAQGFQPTKVRVYGKTLERAIERSARLMGGPPTSVTTSDEWGDWDGPTAMGARW